MLYLISDQKYEYPNLNTINYQSNILDFIKTFDFNKFTYDDSILIQMDVKIINFYFLNNINNKNFFKLQIKDILNKFLDIIKKYTLQYNIHLIGVNNKNNNSDYLKLLDIFNSQLINKAQERKISYTKYKNLIDIIQKFTIINNNKKLVIYSYNFGNYRSELDKIDNFIKLPYIEYFFYSDVEVKSKKWIVKKFNLKSELDFISKERHTTKYIKYKYIPEELKEYKYILHLDSSRISYLNKINFNNIFKILDEELNISYFSRKHQFLNGIYQESKFILNRNMENKPKLIEWINYLKKHNFKQNITHMENCIFIRNIQDNKLNKIFENVYDTQMRLKLKRDQMIFIPILQQYNFTNYKILTEFNI